MDYISSNEQTRPAKSTPEDQQDQQYQQELEQGHPEDYTNTETEQDYTGDDTVPNTRRSNIEEEDDNAPLPPEGDEDEL